MRTNCATFNRRKAKGVALLIALIALVGVTLAGLALVRSVGTGLEISGNMAFKEASVAIADLGTETGIRWLKANYDKLNDDGAVGSGYYASFGYTKTTYCDLTGNKTPTDTDDDMVWDSATAKPECGQVAANVATSPAKDAVTTIPAGYNVYYVINRLCNKPGDPQGDNTVVCHPMPGAGSSARSTMQAPTHSLYALPDNSVPYYRVTAKVVGPRNSVAYTQALVGMQTTE